MTDRYRLSIDEPPGRGYGWRAWLAWHLLRLGCRHQRGIVCSHRHYEYDFWLKGSHAGYTSGVIHERGAKPDTRKDTDRE
jgi:hypothetical protein